MTIFATIRGMAGLFKQKGVVKKLDNFYRLTGYSGEEARQYRLANQIDGGVPEEDFLGYLEINNLTPLDHIKYFFKRCNFSKKTGFILNRRDKIKRVYQSCLDDGYIERVQRDIIIANTGRDTIKTKEDVGIKPSEKNGKDLTHWMGFMEAVLIKYPVTWGFILKLIGCGAGTYFLIKLGNYVIHHWILYQP